MGVFHAARNIFKTLENWTYDATWKTLSQNASKDEKNPIVIIDINEESLRIIGPWPWNRHEIALLVSKLDSMGAKTQILDIVFNSERADDQELKKSAGIDKCGTSSDLWA